MAEYALLTHGERGSMRQAVADFDGWHGPVKTAERSKGAQKTIYVFQQNIAGFVQHFGVEKCGFLTLTFADDVFDVKEASRRFNSFRTNFLSKHFCGYIGVYERTKRGVVHFHFVVACKENIAEGFDHEAVKRNVYTKNTRNAHIAALWKLLRDNLQKYGFGLQHQLVPVKSKDGIAKYLSKYITKGLETRSRSDKGFRFTRASQDKDCRWKQANYKFSWAGENAAHWRKALAHWVAKKSEIYRSAFYDKTGFFVSVDEENYTDIFKIFHGAKWCHRHKDAILLFYDQVIGAGNAKRN